MFDNQELFVLLYNILFLVLFLLWIYRERLKFKQIANSYNLNILWIIAGVFLISSLILNTFILVTDVDDAIISGTKAFIVDGKNPYAEKVVVHLLNGKEVSNYYHYFPSDLLVYSLIYLIFSPLGLLSSYFTDSWFLIGNFLFLFFSFYIIKKIIKDVPNKRLLPPYIIVTCMFLFSNSSLMVLYFVFGYYFFKVRDNAYFGVLFYILAAGVKYMTGLFLLVHFIEEVSHTKKKENLSFLKPYLLGSVIFLITIIPFGILNVLNATFLYQGDVSTRMKIAGIYGPILIELALWFNFLDIYTFIFVVFALLSFIIAFKYGKNTYKREMIISFLFMFILPFYGTELIVVSILLWYFSLYDKELNFPDTSSHFSSKIN